MIASLIEHPESKTLEFKRDLSSPRSVLRSLVAFANSAGGHLILEPAIEELAGRIRFTVPLAEILPLTREQSRKGGAQPAPVTAPVGDYVNTLLRLLGERGPLGNEDIRLAFGLKSRRRLRETYLAPALSAGLIQYTLPDRPNSRMQKYSLTDKGRQVNAEG